MSGRFSGKDLFGEDYDLFRLICPHLEVLQATVAGYVEQYAYHNSHRTDGTKITEVRVLEIGCGTGETTKAILSRDVIGVSIKVVSVDNEHRMLTRMRLNPKLRDYFRRGRLELVEADALDYLLVQPCNSFDVFASAFTLHNFEWRYRYRVLEELYKVLKPRGRFVNGDKYAISNRKRHEEDFRKELDKIRRVYGEIDRLDLAIEWEADYLEDNYPELLMQERRAIRNMKGFGFKNLKVVFREGLEAVLVAEK